MKINIKKVALVVLGFFTVTSIVASKKIKDILDISNELKYTLASIPHSISWRSKTVKLDVKIENPTEYNLDASTFALKNLRLILPNESVIASSTNTISNVIIPAYQYTIIKDVKVKITVSLLNIVSLITNWKKLKLKADVYAIGKKIYSV